MSYVLCLMSNGKKTIVPICEMLLPPMYAWRFCPHPLVGIVCPKYAWPFYPHPSPVSYCHCPPSIFPCFHKQIPAGIQAHHSLTHCPIILWRLSPALYKRVPGSELSFSHFSPNRLNYSKPLINTSLFYNTTIFFILWTKDSHGLSHILIIGTMTRRNATKKTRK